MPKKIEEIPLPRENFLAGYKPITPKFALDDDETSVLQTSKTYDISEAALDEYKRTYLAPSARQDSKTEKVYISRRHFDYLNAIAMNLKSVDGSRMTMSGFICNMIEEHISKYRQTLAELVNRSIRTNPFDNFKD